MKIAIWTVYGDLYNKDKLFHNEACNIGENLLMPNIILKELFSRYGHEMHTADIMEDFDAIIFMDLPTNSILTIDNFLELIKYIIKRKWKDDYLYKAAKKLNKNNIILLINEPPTVQPKSYNKKYHRYFGKILTWNDDLIDGEKYIKFFIPQYWNNSIKEFEYQCKRDFVIIAGNKYSDYPNELYSTRRKIIEYFEEKNDFTFDLYGFGWEHENISNYKGPVDSKLNTLSRYKFCFCYENIFGMSGYITEKIFDCFFSGCVPIYLGASDVDKFIPPNTFIDARRYDSIDAIVNSVISFSKETYEKYLSNAKQFLQSKQFVNYFSVDNYVNTIKSTIFGDFHNE